MLPASVHAGITKRCSMNRFFMESLKMMRDNYIRAFGEHYDEAMCPIKTVEVDERDAGGIVTASTGFLRGLTIDGFSSLKRIYTNDISGKTEEILDIRESDGSEHEYEDIALTRFRCSLMTVFAMEQLLRKKPRKVGLIGTGRTNLANCIGICERYDPRVIVIRGSKRNVDKNIGDFLLVSGSTEVDDSKDMSLLNACDAVIVCTSATKEDEMISSDLLYGPDLIISLDSGYCLDHSFRRTRDNFSDCPAQLEAHFADEFPRDGEKVSFKNLLQKRDSRKCAAYLYGIGLADAVAGEKITGRIEEFHKKPVG